jgi:dienelactone hydrolase
VRDGNNGRAYGQNKPNLLECLSHDPLSTLKLSTISSLLKTITTKGDCMKKFYFGLLACLLSTSLLAGIRTENIDYKDGKVVLQGTLVFDDALNGKRPAVVVVHEWVGLDDYARKRAHQLAEHGYVAFALDMYGKGVMAKNTEEAGKMSGMYKSDRALMRRRALAGLEVLKKQKNVDINKIAAIGYCFGGTVVLEIVRSGADVKGVVSFHGGVDSPTPEDAKNIKGKVLVLHGGDDPYVPMASVVAFEDEMLNAGVDWQLNTYSKSVHGFTNPKNGSDPSKGVAYNADADRRSWQAMKNFFDEVLK